MFTRQELLAELQCPTVSSTPSLEAVEFDQYAFTSPCSEQCIQAFRGFRKVFESGIQFWVKSLQAKGWEGRAEYFRPYAESAMCAPLSEEELFQVIAEYSGLLQRPLPSFLTPRAGFRAALQMYGAWNDVAVVAEFADEFVAFYWSTTA